MGILVDKLVLPDKWKLWAQSAYPYAIPWKQTTMVVEAMWENFKCGVLYNYNCLRVDFATFSLVIQALPAYRHKLLKHINDPHKGQAASLHGEQILIKKAWEFLYNREIGGSYNTNVGNWTCNCGTQKYHLYLLCKHLVKAVNFPSSQWWTTACCTTPRPTILQHTPSHVRCGSTQCTSALRARQSLMACQDVRHSGWYYHASCVPITSMHCVFLTSPH